MVAEKTPSASYHNWGYCAKDPSLSDDKYARYAVGIRGKDFESGNTIDTETDEGHTGTANIDQGDYRTKAESGPNWEDKCRFTQGFEDAFYHLLGNVNLKTDGTNDLNGQPVSGSTGAYTYAFSFPPQNPNDLPFVTIYNGFAKTSSDCRVFNNAILNEFELSMSNENAPTIKSTYTSDYNNMNCINPTRLFAANNTFVKSKQVNIYYADLDVAKANLKDKNPDGSYKYRLGCYLEGSLNVKNNYESQACSGDEYGKTSKFMGVRETTGSIKLPWSDKTKHIETEFESLIKGVNGHSVSEDSLFKQLLIEIVGNKIGSTNSYYSTDIYLPKITITKAESPLSGTDAKELTFEYKVVEEASQSFMDVDITTSLSKLRSDSTGCTLDDLKATV